MSNITLIFNYNGTGNVSPTVGVWVSILVPVLVLVIRWIFESFLVPYYMNSTTLKNVKNIILKNVRVFKRFNTTFDKFQNMALYHLGMMYRSRDWLKLLLVGILSFPIYIGLLYLEAYLAKRLNLNDSVELFRYLLAYFLLILLGTTYIKYKRDLIAVSIFSSSIYQSNFKYVPTKTSKLIEKFGRIRTYSYFLVLLNMLLFMQFLVNVTILSTVEKDKLSNTLDLWVYLILFILATILWLAVLININKLISYYVRLNLLTTLFELGKLPYVKLGLFNGSIISGWVFDPFTNKKYLVLLDSDNNHSEKAIETIFVPWKSVEWIKFE